MVNFRKIKGFCEKSCFVFWMFIDLCPRWVRVQKREKWVMDHWTQSTGRYGSLFCIYSTVYCTVHLFLAGGDFQNIFYLPFIYLTVSFFNISKKKFQISFQKFHIDHFGARRVLCGQWGIYKVKRNKYFSKIKKKFQKNL